jgi:1-aminocyclopropane-1-carboxylate deaminase/D-cysteine desulfhydrase-like pyridoxal-dependent ACC family enzyme
MRENIADSSTGINAATLQHHAHAMRQFSVLGVGVKAKNADMA